MDDGIDIAIEGKIREAEMNLLALLGPYELHIMSFQSVLVWEKPYHSAALLAGVNGLFW